MLMLVLTHLMLMSMLKKKKINKKLCLLTWPSINRVVTDDHDADADADADSEKLMLMFMPKKNMACQ